MADILANGAVAGESKMLTLRKTVSAIFQSILGTGNINELSSNLRSNWRRRFGGTLLMIMYLLVFYTVLLSLTALQIQARVQAKSGDKAQSIWTVIRYANEIRNFSDELAKIDFYRNRAKDELLKREEQRLEIDLRYNEEYHALAILLEKAQMNKPDYTNMEQAVTSANNIFTLVSNDKITDEDRNEAKIIADNISKYSREYIRIDADKGLYNVELISRENELTKIIENKKVKEKEVGDRGLLDVVDELRFFAKSNSTSEPGILSRAWQFVFGESPSKSDGDSYQYVSLPNEVLILMVVIAMGTMGSMISITQVFFAGEDRPLTFYLFRPLLGAVVAIGVYVIAKAGVVVASSVPVQGDGTASLSPFFVAFVSLISGLMSETAISSIRSAGTSFLRGDPVTEKARYAKGVAEAMETDKKQAKNLYPFFDIPTDTVDKWISEAEPVPGDAQRIIAAWLEQPVRNLFSDIPPVGNGNAIG